MQIWHNDIFRELKKEMKVQKKTQDRTSSTLNNKATLRSLREKWEEGTTGRGRKERNRARKRKEREEKKRVKLHSGGGKKRKGSEALKWHYFLWNFLQFFLLVFEEQSPWRRSRLHVWKTRVHKSSVLED